MACPEIREPVQKRSIEKKEKIIQAGFNLICSKGYHNTNTAQIAKEAGVSTGIIYQYFKDKHDILIEGIRLYANSIFYPMLDIQDDNITIDNFSSIIRDMIDKFLKTHKLSQIAHEEITAMTHSDAKIAQIFRKSEIEITDHISSILLRNGFKNDNLQEKVHIVIGMIDNLCHEIVYHRHDKMNYDAMRESVIDIISYLFK